MDNKARVLSDLGRYDAAVECIDKAISIDKAMPIGLKNHAYVIDEILILNYADRHDAAVECARELIEQDIEDEDLQYVIDMALYALGLLNESLNALNTAKRLNPTFQDIENLEDIMAEINAR